jgi:hypothetical protein
MFWPIGPENRIVVGMVTETPVTPFAGEIDCSVTASTGPGPLVPVPDAQDASVASTPIAKNIDRAF